MGRPVAARIGITDVLAGFTLTDTQRAACAGKLHAAIIHAGRRTTAAAQVRSRCRQLANGARSCWHTVPGGGSAPVTK
jgi:hypothetical protein